MVLLKSAPMSDLIPESGKDGEVYFVCPSDTGGVMISGEYTPAGVFVLCSPLQSDVLCAMLVAI